MFYRILFSLINRFSDSLYSSLDPTSLDNFLLSRDLVKRRKKPLRMHRLQRRQAQIGLEFRFRFNRGRNTFRVPACKFIAQRSFQRSIHTSFEICESSRQNFFVFSFLFRGTVGKARTNCNAQVRFCLSHHPRNLIPAKWLSGRKPRDITPAKLK